VHEIGHVLGIFGTEPGEYNIDPQHVGGLTNVLVLEGGGGHLGGGIVPPSTNFNIVPGFLMCNSCGVAGLRRFATATDVLVVAEDQDITVVQLARVGRISSGNWSDTHAWIGGDMPDATQDAYISHGGMVTLDVDAGVKTLLVSPGNALAVGGHIYATPGTITFTGGNLTVGSGGTIAADKFIGNPGSIFSAAGSLVRFNQFTEVSPTSANFGGSVAIGHDVDPSPSTSSTTFNPNSFVDWNIGQHLILGDENDVALAIDNGTWDVNGNVTLGNVITFLNGGWTGGVALQNNGVLDVGGNLDLRLGAISVEDAVPLEDTVALKVAGIITIGKLSGITYRDNRAAANRPNFLAGGNAVPFESSLIQIAGGTLAFEDTANANDATVTLEGGSGQAATGALAVFKNNASAAIAEFTTKSGHFGPALAGQMMGQGGQVRFEDTSGAGGATIVNEGFRESVPGDFQIGGTGGRTFFTESSTAGDAEIHNHGATAFGFFGVFPSGATHFFNTSSAGQATITNHGDATSVTLAQAAATVFFDFSSAGQATIENAAAPNGSSIPGRTEFRNDSTAGNATIHNRGSTVAAGGLAGRTLFYDQSTAYAATIEIYEGNGDAGRVEFYNNSKAGNAHITVYNVPSISGGGGGHVLFHDNASAEDARIRLRADGCCNGVQFYNNATAARALIITEDGAGGVTFWNNSTAANATIHLGRGSVNTYYDSSTAASAIYALAGGAQLQFSMNSSAGAATIVADGSSVWPMAGGRVLFNTTSLVNNSTIIANGGTASLAPGATVEFINGARAGNSTITANGPSNGGTGAQISFNSGAQGDTARLIVNAGASVDFLNQRSYGDGSTSVGSIEGAGTFFLRGSHLITGSRNTDTTVSGPIADAGVSGGRLTKVGTGTLTLAGTNNYSGLTTANAGTLSVTGSIPGSAVVNSGSTLNGTGTIGGNVTLNSGGIFAPGTSPGIMAIGSLTMNAGSTLQMELGGTTPGSGYDRIQSSGALAFAGALQVSLYNGFTPSAGQSFDLFNWGNTSGTFSSLSLPLLAGLAWNTAQLYTDGVLSLDAAALPGDFNNDGFVNAADYITWRKGIGVATTPENYSLWRTNFGRPNVGGSAAEAVNDFVPEPASLSLFLAVVTCSLISQHGRDRT
jgi:autotransporter-associated beta strand protein